MTFIAPLGITYGMYKKNNEGDLWFNAENQLRQICIENEIDIFDSCATALQPALATRHSHLNTNNHQTRPRTNKPQYIRYIGTTV